MLSIFPSIDTPEAARTVAGYGAIAALAYAGGAVLCRELPAVISVHYTDAADLTGWIVAFTTVAIAIIVVGVVSARRLWAGKGMFIASILAFSCGCDLLRDFSTSAALCSLIDGLAFYGLINGVRAARAARRMTLRFA